MPSPYFFKCFNPFKLATATYFNGKEFVGLCCDDIVTLLVGLTLDNEELYVPHSSLTGFLAHFILTLSDNLT